LRLTADSTASRLAPCSKRASTVLMVLPAPVILWASASVTYASGAEGEEPFASSPTTVNGSVPATVGILSVDPTCKPRDCAVSVPMTT